MKNVHQLYTQAELITNIIAPDKTERLFYC